MKHYNYICVDFDGTLVVHEYPQIGEEVPYAFDTLHELRTLGSRLILWTMRSDNRELDGDVLTDAVEFCRQRGIEFYGINKNPDQDWSTSPKAYANIYIDDAALGCPLINNHVHRPYVDWLKVREYFGLSNEKYLKSK